MGKAVLVVAVVVVVGGRDGVVWVGVRVCSCFIPVKFISLHFRLPPLWLHSIPEVTLPETRLLQCLRESTCLSGRKFLHRAGTYSLYPPFLQPGL